MLSEDSCGVLVKLGLEGILLVQYVEGHQKGGEGVICQEQEGAVSVGAAVIGRAELRLKEANSVTKIVQWNSTEGGAWHLLCRAYSRWGRPYLSWEGGWLTPAS